VTGRSGEEGSTVPLILVFLMIAAGFVIVAAGATALHLERLRLLTVADGAALAAAESFRVADARVSGSTVVPSLDDADVRRCRRLPRRCRHPRPHRPPARRGPHPRRPVRARPADRHLASADRERAAAGLGPGHGRIDRRSPLPVSDPARFSRFR